MNITVFYADQITQNNQATLSGNVQWNVLAPVCSQRLTEILTVIQDEVLLAGSGHATGNVQVQVNSKRVFGPNTGT